MLRLFTFFLVLALGNSAIAQVAQKPVASPDTIAELFAFLGQCVHFHPGSEGSELTLRFSLTPYGALRGKPMITYSKLVGAPEAQRQFVSDALAALENCTPVPMTEHFGKVAGQKMILWRVGWPSPKA